MYGEYQSSLVLW